MVKKMHPRLREIGPKASGSQDSVSRNLGPTFFSFDYPCRTFLMQISLHRRFLQLGMQMAIDVARAMMMITLMILVVSEFQSGGVNGLIELSLWLLRAFITVSDVKKQCRSKVSNLPLYCLGNNATKKESIPLILCSFCPGTTRIISKKFKKLPSKILKVVHNPTIRCELRLLLHTMNSY